MLFKIDDLFLRPNQKYTRSDSIDQLELITEILGTAGLISWLSKYNIELPSNMQYILEQGHTKKQWSGLINDSNRDVVNDDALDLLERMLKFDPSERITAKDAMNHPYFDQISENEEIGIN